MTPLGDVLTERRETPTADDLLSGRVRIVEKISFDSGCLQLRVDGATKTGMVLVRPGDLLVSGINAAKGAIAIYDETATSPIAATIHYGAYIPDPKRVSVKYLWWLLRSGLFRDLLREHVPGGIKTELKAKRLLRIPVPLPPLKVQRRIVDTIVAVAGRMENINRLRQVTEHDATALLAALHERFFAAASQWVALGDVCSVVDPNPTHRYPAYTPHGVPMISSSDFVGEDDIDWSRARMVPESFYADTLGRLGLGGNDILFSRKGKVGYARRHPVGQRLAMTHTLCVLKPDTRRISSDFLLHFTRSTMFIGSLTATMNPNSGVPTLGLGVIRDTACPLPAIADQERIARLLDRVRSMVSTLTVFQGNAAVEGRLLLSAVLDRLMISSH